MKTPLTDWLKRRKERKGSSKPPRADVEHLKAGQVLHSDRNQPNPMSLVLKGRCETPARLSAGDAFKGLNAEPQRERITVRAIADSAVLRLSREALHRLAERWSSISLRSEHRPSFEVFSSSGERGGKVVCLAPLSQGIPYVEFSLKFADTIVQETGDPVLCVMIGDEETGVSTGRSSLSAMPGHDGVFMLGLSGGREEKNRRRLSSSMERLRDRFSHILIGVARDVPVETFREILRWSGAVYPILRQNGESLFELNLLVREAREHSRFSLPIKPLVYLEAEENAHGLSCYIEDTVKRPVHFYLREADNVRLQANLRRLGREICGHQIGLALSSGAARGLSHIGVIQVLEENGVEVDVVAGASIGAYIASVWGVGYGGREMEQFARELEGYRGFWSLMDLAIYPRRGFLLTNRVRKRLEKTIGASHFSDLVRPIRVVATRLDTLERVIFSGGNVVDAVLASIAIPGICVPVTLDGVPYIDGGICDPLPVDVLTEMGIRKIIAVNTIATPETLRACQHEMGAEIRARNSLRELCNTWLNPFARGNAFHTMMLSIHAAQTRIAEASCREASVVLRPYWCWSHWHDFGNPSRYIPLGRQAAEAQLPAIRALIDSPVHENKTSPHIMAEAA